jgi:opacity protein-like surface antigen
MNEDDFKSFDVGAIAGAGLDFNVSDRMVLNIDGRYYFGATESFAVDVAAVSDVKNRGVSGTVGLLFLMGK